MSNVESDHGLRERKKQRTRQAIEAAAFRLFEERGFGATTIADIAAAADISPRTFFGYFASKEAVLWGGSDEAFAAFERDLAAPRERGTTALDVLREWCHAWFTEHPPDEGRERLLHRLKLSEPSVAAHERRLLAAFEDAMTSALATDLALEVTDVRARMVAAAAVASLRALQPLDDDECRSGTAPPDEALAVLDDALLFLSSGLAALLPPKARSAAGPSPRRSRSRRPTA